MKTTSRRPAVYGLMAEFEDPTSLIAATHGAYQEGYRVMDAYSPYPIEELHEALGSPHTRLPLVVNVGMWLERFVIIVLSLHRDYLPSSWGNYSPTFWDWSTYVGTIGLFLTLLFLFLRYLPMISIFEMRTMLPEARVEE